MFGQIKSIKNKNRSIGVLAQTFFIADDADYAGQGYCVNRSLIEGAAAIDYGSGIPEQFESVSLAGTYEPMVRIRARLAARELEHLISKMIIDEMGIVIDSGSEERTGSRFYLEPDALLEHRALFQWPGPYDRGKLNLYRVENGSIVSPPELRERR